MSFSKSAAEGLCAGSPRPDTGKCAGGEGRIRTSEGVIQQIYSLPRLAASVPLRLKSAHASPASGLPSQASRTLDAHNLLIDARDLNESFACRDVSSGLLAELARGLEPLTCGLQIRRSTS